MTKNEISHEGKITQIDPQFTTVEIVSSSACSECHARSLCSVSEDVKKEICVPTDPFTVYAVGDSVKVCMKRTMGMKAVWLSYVIPVAILMVLILVFSSVTDNELVTGLVAIAGVALYYLVIYLLRNKLQNEYVFYIK